MAAETGYTIQGKIYPEPDLMSLNCDENQVIYECTGFSQDDFFRMGDETREEWGERVAGLYNHPMFEVAWMRIAFQRGNPHLSKAKVEQIVGKTNRFEATATLRDDQVKEGQEDDRPLASTSEHNEPSTSSLNENETTTTPNSETPSTDSATTSENQDSQPNGTGGSNSDTQPISLREISAA